MKKIRVRNPGITLIEALIAASVLLVILVSLPSLIVSLRRTATLNQDRAFAAQKASQMMEELRAFTKGAGDSAASKLDDFDDGDQGYRAVLTTDPRVVTPPDHRPANPADLLSGNPRMGTAWKFVRQVRVQRTPQAGSRQVSVRVFFSDPSQPDRPRSGPALAEVSGILHSPLNWDVPHQVFDVYALALDNVPGRWYDLSFLKPMLNAAGSDLTDRNQGLQTRIHYITQLAYGRDPYYAPYINTNAPSDVDPSATWAYLYPGLITNRAGSPASQGTYFVAADLLADGYRMLVDGALQNGYTLDQQGRVTGNSLSVADQFNHALRYPDELATYNRLLSEALAQGFPAPEPSLRLLLERLNDAAQPYRNAIVLNLHGELQPLPPLRNYSDPARDPVGATGVRLVTHPEQLAYPAGSTVKLRVYAYRTDPDNAALPAYVPVATLFISTGNQPATQASANAAVSVRKIMGFAGAVYRNMPALAVPGILPLPNPAPPPPPGPGDWPILGFDYRLEINPAFDDDGSGVPVTRNGVLLTLFNTPTTCPKAADKSGLDQTRRLYGMEYIPNPVGSAGGASFAEDLTATDTRPKNTARWLISLDTSRLAGLGSPVSIETRIGNDLSTGPRQDGSTTGHAYAQLANLSRTYAWVGGAVPVTERYQVQGDPRYNPYLDVQAGNAYNWYFNGRSGGQLSSINTTDYPNFPRLKGLGWTGDDYDVARLFALLREGLMRANATFVGLTGYTGYYAGLGGEIGTNGVRSRFDVAGYPWNLGPTAYPAVLGETNNYADEVSRATRLVARTDKTWFSMPWLGELYPDDLSATWQNSGNLPAPLAAGAAETGSFYRAPWDTSFSRGTVGDPRLKVLGTTGGASFFNGSGGTRQVHFDHFLNAGAFSALTNALGLDLSQSLNLYLPTTISADLPFSLATNSGGAGSAVPPEWNEPEFTGSGTTLAFLDGSALIGDQSVFYFPDLPDRTGSAAFIVAPAAGSAAPGRAYVAINGLTPQDSKAGDFQARYAFASALQTFMATGDFAGATDPNRTVQVPRVAIQAPVDGTALTNPTRITITWGIRWRRWDDRPYRPGVPDTWAENANVQYQLMYSSDSGQNWGFVADGQAAQPGSFDVAHATTSTTSTVDVSSWPKGSYLFRVEAYRLNMALHYAFHQTEVYIDRP